MLCTYNYGGNSKVFFFWFEKKTTKNCIFVLEHANTMQTQFDALFFPLLKKLEEFSSCNKQEEYISWHESNKISK